MLADLKFVQGAVARKNMVPEMTHFLLEAGRVTAFNGSLALSSPIDCSIDCSPKAEILLKAIQNCEDTVALSLTAAGKLRVQSGKMKVLVDCIERSLEPIQPEGAEVPIDGAALVKAFQTLEPFIGDDASRPWANGVLLSGGSAYATCNVILAQYWLGYELPNVVNVPHSAIREVIRIGEPPIAVQMTDKSITFKYESERWIRTQLLPTDWPKDRMHSVLDIPNKPEPVDQRLFDAIQKIKPFTDKSGRIVFRDGVVRTHDDDEEGGQCSIPAMNIDGVYTLEIFMALKGVATHADFRNWPNPCAFFGHQLRGVIIGRQQ